jgi:RNase P subunit RPR2
MELIKDIIYELSRADDAIANVEFELAKDTINLGRNIHHIRKLVSVENAIIRCMNKLGETELTEVTRGTWRRLRVTNRGQVIWECSECGCHHYVNSRFCGNCGSRMEGTEC